ncbi:uromodulin isoform X2 [Xenopus tropicalis]|uniref:Uromodulin isoform X2 n=1 Tax=Xenopus tropicalis TaxID=8364 RepID=A0A8J1J4D3_XENTR|nr:uromodulin isoform X2 [Xenopus tropicalis]
MMISERNFNERRSSDPSCYGGVKGDPPFCSKCDGVCSVGTGCMCNNSSKLCLPDINTCSMNSSACCLPDLSWYPELTCCIADPYCFPSCLPDEVCEYVIHRPTCIANKTFYNSQNSKLTNVTRIIECRGSNMTVSVSKNLLEFLNYKPSMSSLLQPNCTKAVEDIVQGQRVYSFTVPCSNGECGDTMVKNTSHVTFWNTLLIPASTDFGIVTVNNLSLDFSCTYALNMQSSLLTVFKPVMSSASLNTGNSASAASTTIAAYVDPSYTSPLQQDGQEQLQMGSTLYFGVYTNFSDPNVVLRVDTCFASPTPDSTSPIKVMLLDNGCSSDQGQYIQVIDNGKSKEVRFSFVSFAIQGYDSVYIFCVARLCLTSTGTCSGCLNTRATTEGTAQLGLGPFTFIGDFSSSASCTVMPVAWLVGTMLTFIIFEIQ